MNTACESQASIASSELILGGQKSGKSRRAELLARQWLAQSAEHRAALIATGVAWDDEMRARISRHQADRAARVPGLETLEEPRHVAQLIRQHSAANTLLIVDCLTLWLTNWLMPAEQAQPLCDQTWAEQATQFISAVQAAPGPIILVGNEIGLGVIPMGREVRAFVDALGTLNQRIATACSRVTLMVAGLPMVLKDEG